MMRAYELTHEAAEDLQEVFVYTIDRWGMRQAQSYKTNRFRTVWKSGGARFPEGF